MKFVFRILFCLKLSHFIQTVSYPLKRKSSFQPVPFSYMIVQNIIVWVHILTFPKQVQTHRLPGTADRSHCHQAHSHYLDHSFYNFNSLFVKPGELQAQQPQNPVFKKNTIHSGTHTRGGQTLSVIKDIIFLSDCWQRMQPFQRAEIFIWITTCGQLCTLISCCMLTSLSLSFLLLAEGTGVFSDFFFIQLSSSIVSQVLLWTWAVSNCHAGMGQELSQGKKSTLWGFRWQQQRSTTALAKRGESHDGFAVNVSICRRQRATRTL